jgi:hypothetical protein
MKPLSSKFANRGNSGIARRVAKKQLPAPSAETFEALERLREEVQEITGVRKVSEAVKRSRAKKPEVFRDYQRKYMRKYRAKKRETHE